MPPCSRLDRRASPPPPLTLMQRTDCRVCLVQSAICDQSLSGRQHAEVRGSAVRFSSKLVVEISSSFPSLSLGPHFQGVDSPWLTGG